MKILPVVLTAVGFYGCAYSGHIEDRALSCKPHESEECVKLRERADRWAEEQREKESERCPEGFILFKDNFGSRCVTEKEAREWIRGIWQIM